MSSKLAVTIFAATLGISCSEHHEGQRACTTPLAAWGKPHPHLGPLVAEFTVGLDHNGATYLNGKATSLVELTKLFRQAAPMNPRPIFILETEMGAPCADLDRLRSLMNKELQCDRGGHCDEGMQTVWRDLPYEGKGVP